MLRQSFLPGFSDGTVKIGNLVSMLKKEGRVTYFIGSDNYFSHGEDDEQSRRFVLTSLVENGHARACDLEDSLHIPVWSKNWNGGRTRSHGAIELASAPDFGQR